MPLNLKQQRFVDEYLRNNGNATEAYKVAYDTDDDRAARANGARLIANDSVKAAIDGAKYAAAQRIGLSADGWAEEVSIVAHSDIGDILDFSGEVVKLRPANQIPAKARRSISGVKVKRYVEGRGEDAKTVEVVEFKLWNKLDALKQEGQHTGALKEQLEISGTLTVEQRRTRLHSILGALRQRAGTGGNRTPANGAGAGG